MTPEDFALILSISANFVGAIFLAYGKMYGMIQNSKKKTNLEINKLRTIIDIFLHSKNFEEAKKLANLEMAKLDQEEQYEKTKK